jgi:hypothetical protein
MASNINQAIFKLVKRAEKQDTKHIIDTFVDVGPLFTLLQNKDHQIIYGRRGTGKTHALTYLINHLQSGGHIAAYIDMRNIGSNGGIYSDLNLPITERATRLLIDTYSIVHDQILDYVLSNDETYDLSKVGPLLDELARSISEIEVIGQIEIEKTANDSNFEKSELGLTASIKDMSFGGKAENSRSSVSTNRSKTVGNARHRVHFTTVNSIFSKLRTLMGDKELWILIDEWAEVPLDLQPFLADLLRRTLFSIRGITIKIAAIEKRTNIKITVDTNYIGIEAGADISSSLNLDEFMVFDNDPQKSRAFYQQLIYKHVNQLLIEEGSDFANKETFTNAAFTQVLALEELVRASEGVPRDAINILIHSAIKADNDKISIPNIRTAAKNWYTTDKEKAVLARPKAKFLLRWIIDEVIGKLNSRAFLLSTEIEDESIEYLFDNRILHLIKQGISAKDLPGERFNVFAIDYGTYVQLINTTSEPKGLFQAETELGEEYIEVPVNDYRSIRRSILNVDDFEKNYAQQSIAESGAEQLR